MTGRSPTYEEPHWWTGKTKTRCSYDGKVVFANVEEAKRRARQISKRTPMKAYKGPCGHWHVSRIRRRR